MDGLFNLKYNIRDQFYLIRYERGKFAKEKVERCFPWKERDRTVEKGRIGSCVLVERGIMSGKLIELKRNERGKKLDDEKSTQKRFRTTKKRS